MNRGCHKPRRPDGRETSRRALLLFSAAGALALASAPASAQLRAGARVPLEVRSVQGMGRGVFARRAIARDTAVLRDCTLAISPQDKAMLLQTRLDDYYFEDDSGGAFLVLGMSSLLNHSFLAPNVEQEWEETPEGMVIVFRALRDIKAGEQLFFDYEFREDDEIPPWADNPRK